MAQGTILSQTIAEDEELNRCSEDAALAYFYTLPHLDRDGLITGNLRLLWAKAMPLRIRFMDIIGQLVEEWIQHGLVLRYQGAKGEPVLFFKSFRRHNSNLLYTREPASHFSPPPGYFRGQHGLIPQDAGAAGYLAEALDPRSNYAKELADYAAYSTQPLADDLPHAALTGQKQRTGYAKHAASMQHQCSIDATILGFSPVEPVAALTQHACCIDETTNDDDDHSIYTSSSVVAFSSKGGSGGKREQRSKGAELQSGTVAKENGMPVPSQAQDRENHDSPELAKEQTDSATFGDPLGACNSATATMRQLATEIAGEMIEWTGSAKFIAELNSNQLIAAVSWLWLWDRFYNQPDVYKQVEARRHYPADPFANIRKSLPGKIITQVRLANPTWLHPIDKQLLQDVLNQRMQGKPIRRQPEVSPESEVRVSPQSKSSPQSTVQSSQSKTASSSALTQDSGLLLTQESGLTDSAQTIWSQVLTELALTMPSATFNTWLRDTWVIDYATPDPGAHPEFVIGLANVQARDWLENRMRFKLQRTLASLLKQPVSVRFQVVERKEMQDEGLPHRR